jgi:hypothetical protein
MNKPELTKLSQEILTTIKTLEVNYNQYLSRKSKESSKFTVVEPLTYVQSAGESEAIKC